MSLFAAKLQHFLHYEFPSLSAQPLRKTSVNEVHQLSAILW